MEENGEWRSIGGEDNDLADATVEGFCRFVGSLLELAVMLSLLD